MSISSSSPDVHGQSWMTSSLERSETSVRAAYPLRNITHSLGPLGESDLDPVVTESEQYAWLNQDADLPDVEQRADDPEQRRLFAPNYARLTATPFFPYVALIANMYVQGTIPKPRETERTFWSLSAMPSTNRTRLVARI